MLSWRLRSEVEEIYDVRDSKIERLDVSGNKSDLLCVTG